MLLGGSNRRGFGEAKIRRRQRGSVLLGGRSSCQQKQSWTQRRCGRLRLGDVPSDAGDAGDAGGADPASPASSALKLNHHVKIARTDISSSRAVGPWSFRLKGLSRRVTLTRFVGVIAPARWSLCSPVVLPTMPTTMFTQSFACAVTFPKFVETARCKVCKVLGHKC